MVNNHTVPAFYQKGFTCEQNDELIYVRSLRSESAPTFPDVPKNHLAISCEKLILGRSPKLLENVVRARNTALTASTKNENL